MKIAVKLRDTVQDLRVGVRLARRTLFTSAVIVACLGLGVGSMATVFAWLRALVLRPIPAVNAPEQLLSLSGSTARGSASLSYPAYQDMRQDTRAFPALAAFGIRRFSAAPTDDAATSALPVWGVLASSNYFEVLGVRPALGRAFLAHEEQLGGPLVAIVSHTLWQTRFAGEPDVVGRSMRINGREATIVGVAPPDFRGTITGLAFDVWLPITTHPELGDDATLLSDRATRWLQVFGRLRSGVTLRQARDDVAAAGRRISDAHLEDRDYGLSVDAFDTGPARLLRPLLAVLFGITILLLAIVCFNVANILMLRGAGRAHELEVRAALGANRMRLVRQLLAENLVLAAAGIGLAFVVAWWGRRLFASLTPASSLPISLDAPIDWGVAALTLAAGITTLVAFGALPALRASRQAMRATLATSARTSSRSGTRLRGLLVSAQFALSLAAIVSCGLFLRRMNDLANVDRGFSTPDRVLLVTTDLGLAGYRGDSQRRDAVQRILTRLRAHPGVQAAAAATFVPLGFGGYSSQDVRVEGYAPADGESMSFLVNQVSDDYFPAMGVAIVKGRPISSADRAGVLPVAVVNESFAKRFWPADDPTGRRLSLNGREFVVVGIAKDGKYHYRDLDNASPPFVYTALAQTTWYSVVLHVRSRTDPNLLVGAVRSVLTDVDPNLSALSPTTLDEHTSVGLFPVRLATTVLGSLGVAAMILAALGLYAVVAHSVRTRYREIGIRMALGASNRRIVLTVAKDSWRYVAVGVTVGALAAMGLSRLIASALPNIDTGDVVPFAVALPLLLLVAALATVLPAWKATTMAPTIALKGD